MIKNARQYSGAKRQIGKLEEALDLSKKFPIEMDKKIYKAMIIGIESQIREIQNEIEEYEKLQKEKQIPSDTLNNMGSLLIKARIACQFSQKELAEKVGIAPQQIQKYEANEYKSAKLDRLEDITKALGFNAIVELATMEVQFNVENTPTSWNVDAVEIKSDIPVQKISSESDLASISELLSNSPWDFEKKKEAA